MVENTFLFQFSCPITVLFICFGTIHVNKTPTELIQLDLVHSNHPDVLVFMDYRDSHQRSLQEVVERHNSSMLSLGSSLKNHIPKLLSIEKANITYYNERVVSGIIIEKQHDSYIVKMLYSGNFLHSSPIVVNLISNMILQRVSRDRYEIHINNKPFRFVIFKKFCTHCILLNECISQR